MKKIYCVMLSALMMLNAFPAFVYASDTLSGEGTKENPYIVSSAADYQIISDSVKNGESYKDKYFIQTADFEFENAPADETVVYGMGESEFAGIYDGKGYTIALADSYKEVCNEEALGIKKIEGGLFGNLTGIVKNVTVKGSWRLQGDGGIIAKKVSEQGKIINCGVVDFKALHAYDWGTRLFGLASTEGYSGTAIINCFGYFDEYIVTLGENYPVTDNADAAKKCYYCIKSPDAWGELGAGTILENPDQVVSETKMGSLHSVLNANIEAFEEVSGIDRYQLMLWKNGGSAPISKGEYYIDPVELVFDFKGDGTYESPFLIETIDDYNKMAEYIRNGDTDFKGKYFLQTADIAFETAKKEEEFVYGLSKGDEFAGTYNGNGYSITLGTDYNHIAGYEPGNVGVTMLNQGLFGRLSGVVMNVVIRGIWRLKDEGGLIAHTVVDNGKIINCGTRNFGLWAIFASHSFYGFASTKEYEGTAIYNCFYNSHYSSNPNAEIYFITDTDAYKDCWYHLGDENGSGKVGWDKGEKITAKQMETLHDELNSLILENAKAAGVPAVDLKLWKPSDGPGSPIVEKYEIATIPVPDTKTFTYIGIESDDIAAAGKGYFMNVQTHFKDSDKVVVKIDGNEVLEYTVGGVYENVKEIPSELITEGKHTVTAEGIAGGNVIYSAEKSFVADAGYAENIKVSGSLTSGSEIKVSLDIENCLSQPSDITLLLGVYNAKGGMIEKNIVKYPEVSGKVTDAEIGVLLPEADYKDAKAVLYVWNSLNSMKAMMAEVVVLK